MRLFLPALLLCLCSVVFCSAQPAKESYEQAIAANQAKDFATALKHIDQALQSDSGNVQYLSAQSESLIGLKRYGDAYDVLSQAIERHSGAAWLYNSRGVLLETIQDFDAAITDYNHGMAAAETDAARNLILVNRATAEIRKRDFEQAYADLLEAYQFDSSNVTTITNLAAVCDEVGKGDQTIRYLLRALRIKPDFYPAYGNLGFKYQDMGDYKTAIAYYSKVIAMKPDDPFGYSSRSFNRYKMDDIAGARADIGQSLRLYPDNSYALMVRALIAIREGGKRREVCKDLQRALDLGFTEMFGGEVEQLLQQYCR